MSQSEDIINIQIPYDSNQPMELKYWDRIFQPVSLHGFLEHLLSDAKNIKNSMICIAKYVENEKIDINKSKKVPKLRGIGEATWKLISAIYSSEWNSLFADKNNNSFRQKVSFKYTPNVNLMKNGKKGKNSTDKSASIKRLLLLILAKSSKEVKEISKFFKMTSSMKTITMVNHMPKYHIQGTIQEMFSKSRRPF